MFRKAPSLCIKAVCLLSLCLAFAAAHAHAQNAQRKPEARQVNTSILIRWAGKPGVERYRLQLASDAGFNDVVFDQAVVGRQYVVKGMTPGKYFWRVAPAVGETGKFLTTSSVEISESAPGNVEVANVVTPPDIGGWMTATGEVALPVPARLRTGNVFDMLGVNTDGTVFAIDGASGIALWTGRYRPDARRGEDTGGNKGAPFRPLLISSEGSEMNAVVAFDGGVRALRGETGRELWRARFDGRAASGVATDLNGDGVAEIVVVSENPDKFYVLDAKSGRVLSDKKLDAEAVGAPVPLQLGETRGVVLSLKNNGVEIRGADGSVLHSEKLKSEVTTAPFVVNRGSEIIMAVLGTQDGLLALTVPDFKLMGRIAVDDDTLRGTISSADLDGDGVIEIILVTKRGRVAMVSTVDGNVKWYAEGATDAESATFADLNADGVLDVVVPGGAAFAVAFSGRDGSLIWKIDEASGRRSGTGASVTSSTTRALVVAPSSNGGGMVVGSDPGRTGLRAVELPKGAVKTASK